MPTIVPVDLSDPALWQKGFPDDLFVQLRREQPIFHHERTDGVAQQSNGTSGLRPSTAMRNAFIATPIRSPLSTAR